MLHHKSIFLIIPCGLRPAMTKSLSNSLCDRQMEIPFYGPLHFSLNHKLFLKFSGRMLAKHAMNHGCPAVLACLTTPPKRPFFRMPNVQGNNRHTSSDIFSCFGDPPSFPRMNGLDFFKLSLHSSSFCDQFLPKDVKSTFCTFLCTSIHCSTHTGKKEEHQ